MPPGESRAFGKWGEEKALEYLNGKGYTTVFKGFRSRFGEIDLIVKNEQYLVFAEVKTRRNTDFAYAREYVGKTKQRKIIATAKYWLLKNPSKLQTRFDVLEVYAKQGTCTESAQINHIENAFEVRRYTRVRQ